MVSAQAPSPAFGSDPPRTTPSKLGSWLGLRAASPERNAGHGLLQSRRAQEVSLRTTVYRVAREMALVTTIFHPGSSLGW